MLQVIFIYEPGSAKTNHTIADRAVSLIDTIMLLLYACKWLILNVVFGRIALDVMRMSLVMSGINLLGNAIWIYDLGMEWGRRRGFVLSGLF